MPHKIGNRRGGAGLVREPHWSSRGTDHFGDRGRNAVRGIAMVVADEHALARILVAHNVPRNRLRHDARVRESKVFRDDASPAIRSKRNPTHGKLMKEYAQRYSCQP